MDARDAAPRETPPPPEVRWGIGCLIGGAALLGSLVLLIVIVLLVDTPAWIQIVLGTVLPLGSVFLGWLVATALGHRDGERRRMGPRRLE